MQSALNFNCLEFSHINPVFGQSCWLETGFFRSGIDVTTQAKNNLPDITDPIDCSNLEESGQDKKKHQDSRHDYSGSGLGEHECVDKDKDDDQIDDRTVRNTPHDIMREVVFERLLYTKSLVDAQVCGLRVCFVGKTENEPTIGEQIALRLRRSPFE